ncbi:MAG: proline--tRNA ligase [bacterium]|nr:proline--tRNA ligase [bacterium]
MLWSKTYIPTLRESPADAELISHKMLMRGGYIRKLQAGVYNYLPLMQRVLHKTINIVREEMDRSGAIEITMPVLHPAELWQESGRWHVMGKEQMRMKDRHDRDMVLGGTHEEVVTNVIRGELRSYRQLPLNLYQIQVKFRDEIRPRFGLMRGREFLMKDAYTFDTDLETHKVAYNKMVDAYFATFNRCGLAVRKVESDTGAMGGSMAHEFMVIVDTDSGEEVVYFCNKCDYAANVEKAESIDPKKIATESAKPLEKVPTPGAATIEQVTEFLKVPAERLVKTLLYLADGKPVAALIRGDRQINETKLRNHFACLELTMATAEVVEKVTKAPVGFAGPIGLKDIRIVADPEVMSLTNFAVGANENETHYINVNLKRDFDVTEVATIRNAMIGDICTHCKEGTLNALKGIEVGNTFNLGLKYSKALNAKFIDAEGKEQLFWMGSYGIGVTRTIQATVEKYNDEKGIIWPATMAPYQVELVPLTMQDEKLRAASFELYDQLNRAGVEVIMDDRDERAGVKFNDADLIGIPLRVNVGSKSLEKGEIELKERAKTDVIPVKLESAVETVKQTIARQIANPQPF